MVAAVLFAVVAGCTSTQPGQASPNSEQPSGPGGPSSSATGNALVSISACTLLTDAEAQQVVPGASSHRDMGTLGGAGTTSCQWVKPVTNDSPGHLVGVTVRPSQGLKDIVAKAPEEQLVNAKTTGGRSAVLQKNAQGNGTCAVSIAVGSGRVDIFDATQGSAENACPIVNRISDFVEPRLPAA
jgi:hypothetical protein